jgi:hypothetical protein
MRQSFLLRRHRALRSTLPRSDPLPYPLDARSHQARGEHAVLLAEFLAPGPLPPSRKFPR